MCYNSTYISYIGFKFPFFLLVMLLIAGTINISNLCLVIYKNTYFVIYSAHDWIFIQTNRKVGVYFFLWLSLWEVTYLYLMSKRKITSFQISNSFWFLFLKMYLKSYDLFIFMHTSSLLACIYVCHVHVQSLWRSKRVLGSLELEVWTAVSHQALCKSSEYS